MLLTQKNEVVMSSDYILSALKNTVLIISILFLSWILIALILQILSNYIRTKLAKILGIKFYIYVTAIGVMIHELGHLFFCIVFRHKINEVKLFSPQTDGTLGYVSHSYNPRNLYHKIGNFFIGTGPIWGGLIAMFFCSYWLNPYIFLYFNDGYFAFLKSIFSTSFIMRWESWLWLYIIISIISHITLSPPDLAGAKDGFIAICITVLASCLLLGKLGDWEAKILSYGLNILHIALPFIILFIILSVFLALILKIIENSINKKNRFNNEL